MTEVHREKEKGEKVCYNLVTPRPENLPECRKDEPGISQASSKPKVRRRSNVQALGKHT